MTVLTLILDVMDCKDVLDVVVPRILGVEEVVVCGHKGCLPVVCVDDVRMEIYVWQHLATIYNIIS